MFDLNKENEIQIVFKWFKSNQFCIIYAFQSEIKNV